MMNKKMERKIDLKAFKIFTRAISTYEDLPLLFNHLTKTITRFFNFKGCSLMLFDEREKQLFRVSSYGVSQQYMNKGALFADTKCDVTRDTCSCEDCPFMKGETVFIKNVKEDPRIQYPDAALKEGIVSILTVPIKFRGVSTGIMRIYNSERWKLHEDDLDSFLAVADLLGLLIEYNGLRNFFETIKIGVDQLPPRLLR